MMLLREMGVRADASAEAAATEGAGAGSGAAPETTAEGVAATRIQALYRGYLLRNELHQQFAATRIQAIARGFLARCEFDRLLSALEDELAGEV